MAAHRINNQVTNYDAIELDIANRRLHLHPRYLRNRRIRFKSDYGSYIRVAVRMRAVVIGGNSGGWCVKIVAVGLGVMF